MADVNGGLRQRHALDLQQRHYPQRLQLGPMVSIADGWPVRGICLYPRQQRHIQVRPLLDFTSGRLFPENRQPAGLQRRVGILGHLPVPRQLK